MCLIEVSSDFDESGVKPTSAKSTITFRTYLVITAGARNPGIKHTLLAPVVQEWFNAATLLIHREIVTDTVLPLLLIHR